MSMCVCFEIKIDTISACCDTHILITVTFLPHCTAQSIQNLQSTQRFLSQSISSLQKQQYMKPTVTSNLYNLHNTTVVKPTILISSTPHIQNTVYSVLSPSSLPSNTNKGPSFPPTQLSPSRQLKLALRSDT